MKNSTRKIVNGKGFVNVSECMQIPTEFLESNYYSEYLIGYYVGTSFRVVRRFDAEFFFDLFDQLLSLQVDYDKPLVALKVQVCVSKQSVL